ncbi:MULTISPECIES: malonate transporter subunit MadL [Alkalihalophilus]|uniref:Malonate transporter, MadL subunit n=2 Tax=Alkalihalophilus pseudofirmus TaxID=79885 RepID=D3FW12_ALKPO|nr:MULTISPECIES: malonate transporter subunit MadL [Alkalihalophilus]ADC50444.1 malonate transporter, MadL subunit [Alkalihalophilus pseudofirmus OF4]MDV2883592.1 malonate transporter subunit MadL [Alkalihalophilus pseudofirmus]MEC2072164.1 malonate transporter subunit MadL [Alkalihalophilus marmarensis]MED1603190.1 malonate transporter subunit MadL [Alkalihalophilus marmarensis]OLS36550.1 malonate transporter subunit MadL [Alkalihalophilus pseudofirmus]
MVIYGVALLSVCMLVGVLLGDFIGNLIGVSANVGGVGIGMVLLVLVIDYLRRKKKLDIPAEEGIKFWSAIYIPVVVAMAAQQNVVSALSGGPIAILAGTLAVVVSFLLVPVISKVGKSSDNTFNNHTRDV